VSGVGFHFDPPKLEQAPGVVFERDCHDKRQEYSSGGVTKCWCPWSEAGERDCSRLR